MRASRALLFERLQRSWGVTSTRLYVFREFAVPSTSARVIVSAVMAASLALVAGCSSLLETGCTAELRSVIQLDILDSVTRAPAAAGATVLLRGPFTDSLVIPDTSTSSLAHVWFEDRVKAGTYSLLIQKPSYRDWSQSGIRIAANGCHTTTRDHVTALLHH